MQRKYNLFSQAPTHAFRVTRMHTKSLFAAAVLLIDASTHAQRA